jgi:uncharacterized membrane protein (DUF2068 family)
VTENKLQNPWHPSDGSSSASAKKEKPKRDRWETYIAVFKIVKGVVLIVAAVGIVSMFGKDAGEIVTYRISQLGVDPGNKHFGNLLYKVGWASDTDVALVSLGTFVYASLFLIEGIGLWLQKSWAEYFTVVVTGSFIPIEVYEIIDKFSIFKTIVIILNVATVIYLIVRIRMRKKQKHEPQK